MNNKIKNLIFDLGGVIVLSEDVNFLEFDHKFSLPEGTTEKVVKDCFKKKEVRKDFDIEKYFEETFSHLMSYENYSEVINTIFESEKINKELVNWIEERRDEHIISLLTNNTSSLNEILEEKFDIKYLFDFIFNSAEIGIAKPNPKVYHYVLENTKTDPKNCVFVDDSKKNVQAARKLGIRSILFCNNNDFFQKISKLEE